MHGQTKQHPKWVKHVSLRHLTFLWRERSKCLSSPRFLLCVVYYIPAKVLLLVTFTFSINQLSKSRCHLHFLVIFKGMVGFKSTFFFKIPHRKRIMQCRPFSTCHANCPQIYPGFSSVFPSGFSLAMSYYFYFQSVLFTLNLD